MAKMEELTINTEVLEWARKTAGLSIPQVAEALGLSIDYVLGIESRHRKASKTLLHNLAQLYKRPFTVLLLPKPPTEDSIPTDFRTLPVPKQLIGPETAQSLREARRLQEGLSDLVSDDPNLLPDFKPLSVTVNDNPSQVALQIRKVIDVDIREQMSWPTPRYAFSQWRGRLQKLGILVIVEDFPREEARGFSLWHPDLIPMIVVSHAEAPAAQTFTLFHELAHILLRADAMCLKQENQTFTGTIEAWCNKFAAGFLLPEDELRSLVSKMQKGALQAEDLYRVASRFKVSRHVVAIRLEGLDLAPKGYYSHVKKFLDSDDFVQVARVRKESDEPFRRDIPKERLAEVGFATANVILRACKSSALSTIEAADLLRVRPAKFERLSHLALDQSQRYG